MDENFETTDPTPGARFDRFARTFERWELPLGIVLIAAGFVVIGLGWADASGTADVRRQMQALISGGFGGLALVLLGAILVQAQSSSRSVGRLGGKLERVAEAVMELAAMEASHAPPSRRTSAAPTRVIATHASYHAADCDLVAGRHGTRELSIAQAKRQGLRPCRLCTGAG